MQPEAESSANKNTCHQRSWPPRKYADLEEGVGRVSETCWGWKHWYWFLLAVQNHLQLWLNPPEGIMESVFFVCFASDFLRVFVSISCQPLTKRIVHETGWPTHGFYVVEFWFRWQATNRQSQCHANVKLALCDLMISNESNCWCASIYNCEYTIYHFEMGDHSPATYSGSIPLLFGWCIWTMILQISEDLSTLNPMFPWNAPEHVSIVVVNYNDAPTTSIGVKK